MTYDVVTLGETMIRYSPPAHQRIEMASSFEAHVGGSESNTAVGLARLGLKVAWLSRLTDNALGHMIASTLSRWGVDTSQVVWTPSDRVGVYYYEPEQPPRPAQVIYDRANSAFARMKPDELPRTVFSGSREGAPILHTTGITVAAGARAVAARAFEYAQKVGWTLSFDVNHRARLMDADAARSAYQEFVETAEVVFISATDAAALYDLRGEPESVLSRLHEQFPTPRVIVLTMGAQGAAAWSRDGAFIAQPAFACQGVDRLGRGDAFSAGFLYAYHQNRYDFAACLRWGAAMAALKYTIPGDLPIVDPKQVAALVEGAEMRPFR